MPIYHRSPVKNYSHFKNVKKPPKNKTKQNKQKQKKRKVGHIEISNITKSKVIGKHTSILHIYTSSEPPISSSFLK